MIKKTLGEICDEFSIATLKIQRLPATECAGSFRQRHEDLGVEKERQFEVLRRRHLDPETLYKELHEANAAIWNLESDLRTLKIKKWFTGDALYIEIGKRADSIRAINAIRVKYKNKLNELVNDVPELKFEHLSS